MSIFTTRAMLVDNHNRPIQYLRLAVTDRCNLRCQYCMPKEGIDYLPKKSLLSFEELERLVRILADLGITKVRVTGGEPFLRKDLVHLLGAIRSIPGIKELHLTTNGSLAVDHLPQLKKIGIDSVNLSLDTLDPERFFQITRRNEFHKSWHAYQEFKKAGIPVKLNCVVMEGINTDDILPMIELSKEPGVAVRFIEEMPFNGSGQRLPGLNWNHHKILNHIRTRHPLIELLPVSPSSTANVYRVKGFEGTFGIIAAFSRTFCGTCNRIRVTAQGMLKTCLYDDGVLNIRDLMREGRSDESITAELIQAFKARPKDGFEAEALRPVHASMSTIGG